MKHFLLLMHSDVTRQTTGPEWDAYLTGLKADGSFGGGSSVGGGVSFKKGVVSETVSHAIGGYIVVNATDLEQAKRLVTGNPVALAGGTVEVRELPES
jgi:hypothetical protein